MLRVTLNPKVHIPARWDNPKALSASISQSCFDQLTSDIPAAVGRRHIGAEEVQHLLTRRRIGKHSGSRGQLNRKAVGMDVVLDLHVGVP